MCETGRAVFAATIFALVAVLQAQERSFVVNSHESLSRLYVDGVEQYLPNANYRNATDNVTIPHGSRLIAIQAVSTVDVCAGFVGSVTDDYFVTDASWKCSEFGGTAWFDLGFDDSSWEFAYLVGRNGFAPNCPDLEYFPEISLAAYWIWTPSLLLAQVKRDDADPLADRAVFCRGYLPFCETSSPCLNNGTCVKNDDIICQCPPGAYGTYCETVVTACSSEPCRNNGSCVVTGGSNYECHCPSGFTGINCEVNTARTLTITVKSTLYDLFIDGVRQNLTYADNWTIPDNIPLSPINRLIALMAIDASEQCAGVIASVTGDYMVTDYRWKCNANSDVNWYKLGWDDSVWPPAYEVGPNDNVTYPDICGEVMRGIPSISENASWIWTDTIIDSPAYHQTIYCRGYLPVCEFDSPCRNGATCNTNNGTICTCLVGYIGQFCEVVDYKRLTLTAKENLYAAYVDGVQVPLENGQVWNKTDSLSVLSISRLIAVMAIQLDGVCPGILVSVSLNMTSDFDYLVSNASWKCSKTAPVGWAELGFDDAAWPAAVHQRRNEFLNDSGCGELGEVPTISDDAYWIWTDTSVGQDVTVYCRGYLPICDVHPCKNGATCNRNSRLLCTCPTNYTGVYCENLILPEVTTMSTSPAEEKLEIIKHHQNSDTNIPTTPTPATTTSAFSSLVEPPIDSQDQNERRNLRKVFRKERAEKEES